MKGKHYGQLWKERETRRGMEILRKRDIRKEEGLKKYRHSILRKELVIKPLHSLTKKNITCANQYQSLICPIVSGALQVTDFCLIM
jgi:hypothetical protein